MSKRLLHRIQSVLNSPTTDVEKKEAGRRKASQVLYHLGGESSIAVKYDELRDKAPGTVRIMCVSDTHEIATRDLRDLPPVDILLFCGDITFKSRKRTRDKNLSRLRRFNEWLGSVPARHRIVIGGNHDLICEKLGRPGTQEVLSNGIWLENELVEVQGLRIFGTPVSDGNSNNRAFQSVDFHKQTGRAIRAVQGPVDVVVTHGLLPEVAETLGARLYAFGHAHYLWGLYPEGTSIFHDAHAPCLSACSCILDENYDPTNMPIVVDLPLRDGVAAEDGAEDGAAEEKGAPSAPSSARERKAERVAARGAAEAKTFAAAAPATDSGGAADSADGAAGAS